VDGNLSVRKRLAEHRTNRLAPVPQLMIGRLSLEQFDAIGRCERPKVGVPIDASEAFPTEPVRGCPRLEQARSAPEMSLARCRKNLTYATGRAVSIRCAGDTRDRSRGRARDFRVSSSSWGRGSQPFQMRSTMIVTKKALPRRTFLRGMGPAGAPLWTP